ncbi:MAG: hypothetical protein QM482_05950 [Sulfurospirillum sp.]
MKIFLLSALIISSLLSSNVKKLEAQILSSIAHSLVHKKNVNICIDDKNFKGIEKYEKNLKLVSCGKADIVFTSKDSDIDKKCKTSLIFSTSYYLYEHSPVIVGAFFWQKGRPNIIFREKQLKSLGINLPKDFKKYIE